MKLFMAATVLIGSLLFGISSAVCQNAFESNLSDALSGNLDAMCDVAQDYYHGRGTLKDPFKAKCWIKKAYDRGSERAGIIWNDLELWRFSGNCQGFSDDMPSVWVKKGAVYKEPVTGVVFSYIPQGCFLMGCHKEAQNCAKDEQPVHQACLSGFWMAQTEVTQAVWEKVMGSNPSQSSRGEDYPVENVSFDDVREFIRRLNAKITDKVTLPTEAQWEYACRNAGENINYPWDKERSGFEANCGACNAGSYTGRTMPVARFAPNELGLYDMAGNVREWCLDYYDKKAYGTHQSKDPIYDEKQSSRVIRGGAVTDNTRHIRCTARAKSLPGIRDNVTGFRLVLEKWQ